MTYIGAALQVLKSAGHPLTTREILDQAVRQGLITLRGKTPDRSMAARLYTRARSDPQLVKLESPGNTRAKNGSVRWMLRSASGADHQT
jgi:hypothetical protein